MKINLELKKTFTIDLDHDDDLRDFILNWGKEEGEEGETSVLDKTVVKDQVELIMEEEGYEALCGDDLDLDETDFSITVTD